MGDIITAIDGKEIKTSSVLGSAKKKYKAGDTAKLPVYRGGKSLELSITFDEDKNTAAQNSTESGSQQNPGNRYGSFGGYGFNW
jgi:serine protease Do